MAAATSTDELLSLVLVGKTGSGKSSSGNTILGEEVFEESPLPTSCTQKCTQHTVDNVKVIDTPGTFDTSLDLSLDDVLNKDEAKIEEYRLRSEQITREIGAAVSMTLDGVDAFFIVFRPDQRFTQEERDAMSQFFNIFGNVESHVIILLTRGDYIRKTLARQLEVTEKDDIARMYETADKLMSQRESTDPFLQEVYEKVGNRFVILDNEFAREDEGLREAMVGRVLEAVRRLKEQNKNKKYTNEIFEAASMAYQEELRQREQQLKDLLNAESELQDVKKRLSEVENETKKIVDKIKYAELLEQRMLTEGRLKRAQELVNESETEDKPKISAINAAQKVLQESVFGKVVNKGMATIGTAIKDCVVM